MLIGAQENLKPIIPLVRYIEYPEAWQKELIG